MTARDVVVPGMSNLAKAGEPQRTERTAAALRRRIREIAAAL